MQSLQDDDDATLETKLLMLGIRPYKLPSPSKNLSWCICDVALYEGMDQFAFRYERSFYSTKREAMEQALKFALQGVERTHL